MAFVGKLLHNCCTAQCKSISRTTSTMTVDTWLGRVRSGALSDRLASLEETSFAWNNFRGAPRAKLSAAKTYRFRVTSAMRIHFNWQIIRKPIKDAKSGGGGRDETDKPGEYRAWDRDTSPYSIMLTDFRKNQQHHLLNSLARVLIT